MTLRVERENVVVRSFVMPFPTHHFREGQRVWVVYLSGDMAAEVCGRHYGSGRYVRAWVRWGRAGLVCPIIQTFEVAKSFATRHGLAVESEGNK
jgi:hypothetical protein